MYDNVCINRSCPDSLFDMCLRLVNKDINNIQPNMFQCLPSYIKRNILKYATGHLFQVLDRGFKDDETLKALLNKEVMNLQLTNSITTDYTLQNISEICTDLQELTMGGTKCSFTEIAFHNFIPTMEHLTYLSLKNIASVTDKSIRGLAQLEHLKHLNLKGCKALTDACGRTLRNIKLEKLDMSHTLITDDWVGLLEDSPLNNSLLDLNMSHCKNVTNDNLNVLNWSKLTYVGLFGQSDLEFVNDMGKLKFVQWTVPF